MAILDNLNGNISALKRNLSSPYNFKGSTTFSALPTSGNEINDTYYCTDTKCNYTWNGSEWNQSSIGESEYYMQLSKIEKNIENILQADHPNLIQLDDYEIAPVYAEYPAQITIENETMTIYAPNANDVWFKIENLDTTKKYCFIKEQSNLQFIRMYYDKEGDVLMNWVNENSYYDFQPSNPTLYIRARIASGATATINYLALFEGAFETLPKSGINYRIENTLHFNSAAFENSLNKSATIDELEETLNAKDENIGELIIPPLIPVVVGHTMDTWFNNMLLYVEADKIGVISQSIKTNGMQNKFASFTPTETETQTCHFRYIEKNNHKGMSGADAIIGACNYASIGESAGSGTNRNILIIGDSRIEMGIPKGFLTDLFNNDAMSINLLGTRGQTPNLHEGRSGWWAQLYCENSSYNGVDNPFYNNGFDFSYYMNNQNFESVDIVIINLGKNDVNKYGANVFINYIDQMIASIKDYDANIKIILGLSELFCDVDTLGNKDRFLLYHKEIIEHYKNANNIYLSCEYLNVNTTHDFNTSEYFINPRDPKKLGVKSTDVTHPTDSGFGKIADCQYYMIKYIESLNA